jgi:thiol-disulfide isomerase/thioredoxin
MKKAATIVLFFLALSSCKEKLPYGDAMIKPEIILKNQDNFVKYWYAALDLSHDFIGLNDSSREIPKGEFFKQVATGDYLPVRLTSDSLMYYKLYKLNDSVDDYIPVMLQGIGSEAYNHYQWEGKQLPPINFTDLEGKKYNSQSIKGKILVLDFWFIGCTYCVHEMPKLNALVNEYKNRKDILFAAIAFNKENDLKKFMKKIDFQYDVISDTSGYLNKKFEIRAYPTKVIINKEGNIVKILDDQYHSFKNLQETLKKEAGI